ncbi:MAG: hypothetical protein GF383_01215 [Candidatus Lokiarchaeota archaeon]|nr:hypothetical protein [Candidatus Lokiarchaeota archaeon]
MGGVTDEIRGKSKIEVYLKYRSITMDDIFNTRIPDPEKKKECKRQMVWDPNTEEWVLHFYLHT